MSENSQKTILQIIPSLHSGGVERGVVDTAIELKKQGFNPLIASNGGEMTRQLENNGVKHIKLNLQTKNPLKIFSNVKKVKKIIEENQVDLIHTRSRAPMISTYFACKNNPKIKTVSTIHGPYSVKFGNKTLSKLKLLYNSFMFKTDAVITVSNFIKEYSIENYQKLFDEKLSAKITTIPRGVDINTFDPEKISPSKIADLVKEWQIPDKKIILFPARITSWKGHELLIEALKHVKNDYICVFVGSDHGHKDFAQKIKQKIINKNLDSKIKFLGNQKDMPSIYCTSNIVISASTKPEAFGRVAIEAQAMKKIIIATNIGGSLETIIDGQTGFLVKNKDPLDMAEKIDYALGLCDEEAKEIGENARNHIIKNFTNQKMLDSTIEIYKKLLY